MAVLLLGAIASRGPFRSLGIFGYILAAAALGALSVGHEYNDRMLGTLLSQPIARRRIFAIKQAVLACLLLSMAAAASLGFPTTGRLGPLFWWAGLALPVAGGLFIAPHLTMICRSAVAGTVFTIAIPGVLLTVGGLLGMLREGFTVEHGSEFQFVFMLWGTVAQCAISAVMSWRIFQNLEAIEGRGRDVQIPAWASSGFTVQNGVRRRHPIRLLVGKELRLHPMAFVVVGLYVLGWLGALTIRGRYPDIMPVFYVLSVFYSGLIALLVGSVASAEERSLGTIEWQTLMPIAIRTQWAVKVGVALSMTLVLAWGLPALLIAIGPGMQPLHRGFGPFGQPLFGGGLLFLSACALYASSTSASGLRALLVSLPALYAAAHFVGYLGGYVGPPIFTAVRTATGATAAVFTPHLEQLPPIIAGTIVAAVALRLGFANFRSADRPARRIAGQVTMIAASLAFGVVLVAVMTAL
jgi:hypothetical protein